MQGIDVVLGVVIVALIVLLFQKRSMGGNANSATSESALLLKQDMTKLSQEIAQLKDGVNQQMGANNAAMQQTVQRQFAASSRIITEVTERLTKLDDTNKRVVDVAVELKTLQNVLQNPKQRGVLGEYYLDQLLKNVMPPDRYKTQYKLGKADDGSELICDAVIFLDKGKILPVDSKFSLENYNRLIESTDKAERALHARAFKADLKNRIDETSKYIRPKEGTMDYAFMFIPSEAIYYDLLVNKVGVSNTSARDLIEYAFREKNVIIVSPTTFMAYLQTVLQGLRALQIEEQTKEIQLRVGELGRHLTTYDTFMQKLGNSLGTTVNHFNTAHKELKKIDKDVVRIAKSSPSIEPMLLERPTSDD
jgi:DNA recombination protein RmuC